MSQQEPTLITARKQRHTRRRSNRPTLVIDSATETMERSTGTLDAQAQTDLQTEPLAEEQVKAAVATARPLRLPRFFSKVAKEEQEGETAEDEIVKARIARATRSTGAKAATTTKADEQKEHTEQESKPKAASKPAQPPRLFKPRHFLGMGLYLIGAQLLLPWEAYLVQNVLRWNTAFFTIDLFGSKLPIDASLFLNIATLIIFLYALVKFDLLPSTLTARTAAEQRARATRERQSSSNDGQRAAKSLPPAIKQGVKGQDDDLYQAYRQNQRRDKRR